MADIMTQLEQLEARVKRELGLFLANQSTLLALRDRVARLGNADLSAQYQRLYSAQKALEDQATSWGSRLADLKTSVMAQPDIQKALRGNITTALFTGDFWSQVTAYGAAAIPLINEGLSLSARMVTQNGDVALLAKSVATGAPMLPTATTAATSTGLMWAYGTLGVALAYFLASGKKQAAK